MSTKCNSTYIGQMLILLKASWSEQWLVDEIHTGFPSQSEKKKMQL
jgi:hypothetical protein